MYKKILRELFPWIELRDVNLPRYKIFLIYLKSIFSIIMMSWLIWIFIGLKVVFSYKYKYDGISFHTTYHLTQNEKKNLNSIVKRIHIRLLQHNINIKELKADINLEKDDIYYKLSLTPGVQFIKKGDTAVTIFSNIFIPSVNLVSKTFGKKNQELLEDIMLHELVHVWQNKYYNMGLTAIILKIVWVQEGYASYLQNLAGEKNEKILRLFLKNKHSIDEYVAWAFMVKHAIEKMHKTVDELHEGKVDFNEVWDSLLVEYNTTKEEKR